MAILINENTRVVIQGITGREGVKTSKQMMDYGTKISCGVTPGRGGTEVNNLKVFDSVKEALVYDSEINTSVIYVPPLMVLDAVVEAIKNDIKLIIVITENVPIKDSALMLEIAKMHNCRIVGPSSIGVMTVGVTKVGSIGGYDNSSFSKGRIGIISKSGGMCSETALLLSQNGFGQSTVMGIGGDVIAGSNFVDLLELFEIDSETDAVCIYGEIGGKYEEQIAEYVKNGKIKKPIIAYISGKFAETLPKTLSLGHVGAIVEKGSDSADYKRKILREAGIFVADFHDEIPYLVNKALGKV
jgi:succinyl-CoA synthetase alpha subunit